MERTLISGTREGVRYQALADSVNSQNADDQDPENEDKDAQGCQTPLHIIA